jgi:hypothetical protein
MTFVEGTRVRPAKLARSQAYAREHGMKELHHVLVPRTKGFVASVQNLRGHVTAVYDLTIGYENGVPTLWQWIKGYVRRVHLHVRRYPVESLPVEEEPLSAWLVERFEEKDRLLESYYRSGSFPDGTAPRGTPG